MYVCMSRTSVRSSGLPSMHGRSKLVPMAPFLPAHTCLYFVAVVLFSRFYTGVLFWVALAPLLCGITLVIGALFGFISLCYWEDDHPAVASSIPVVHVSESGCSPNISKTPRSKKSNSQGMIPDMLGRRAVLPLQVTVVASTDK